MTHDLEALLDIVGERDPDAEGFRGLVALNPFAVQLRCEAVGEDIEPLDRDTLIEELRLLKERVQAALKTQQDPN